MEQKVQATIEEVPTTNDSIKALKEQLGAEVYVKTGLGRRFIVRITETAKRPTLIALHL